ncbi:hypothetical protein NIES2135_67590 (plasmid) [Leptolyngbya boryana NIES-2135]|jgi:hypothetical protein|uniref:Calcium-binding protein n=1 Tax=Leptolyngbya boryana NIES-2135 TaxID=1973484 RepID=A0A1Z4JT33_LEPBY|nr:hypothetical protein NIES2135_67590 [Leptolyngbya boryana NIES-2135]
MSASEHSIDRNSHHSNESGAVINGTVSSNHTSNRSQGTSIESDRVEASLSQAVSTDSNTSRSHRTSSPQTSESEIFNHISPDQLKDTKAVNSSRIQTEANLSDRLGTNGDLLAPGGGTNTIISSQGNDIILGNAGGFNTITTGEGSDLLVLGRETTNRVFDFNPEQDQFGINDSLSKDIVIGQGQNPTKGGIDQPLDSENNTVIIDRSTDHILASLTFTNTGDISDRNFVRVENRDLQSLQNRSTTSKEA